MSKYGWEEIPSGEIPEWGEWIKLPEWNDEERFVAVSPLSDDWWVTVWEGDTTWWTSAYEANGAWLRRVEDAS